MRARFVFATLLVMCAAAGAQTLPASTFNVRDFGAIPDGQTTTTKQLQAAIDAAAKAGGGTVLVPAGNYVTGTLWLRSNINLCIDAGATLLGSQNEDDFPMWTSKWE